MDAYLGPIISLVIVGIGGAIIKIFVDRAFRSIDESIKSLEKEQKDIWEYAEELHDDVIRLKAIISDTSKLLELRAEFIEKFQTNTSAEADFNRLLSLLDSLTAKFEKLEEKIFKRGSDD